MPLDAAQLTCVVVEDLLSPAECERLIGQLEAAGIGATGAHYPPSYRDNDRVVLDSPELAAQLYPRLIEHAPAEQADPEGRWVRTRLNPRFRCCRYRDGQRFTIHRDGVHHDKDDASEHSRLTFMIYLNDGEEFLGGATRYYTDRSGSKLLRSVRPRRGACIIFDHALWHDGEAVTRGTKYVLRSDVMYRRIDASATGPIPHHHGYIWTLARLLDGTLASGGRDQTVRIWSSALAPAPVQVLRGHQSSVSCLTEACGKLWSGDRQGTLRSWQRSQQGWQQASAFSAHRGAVLSLLRAQSSRFGECALSSGADGIIRGFAASPAPLFELPAHQGWVWSLATGGTDSRSSLWSGGEDGQLLRFSLDELRCAAATRLGTAVHVVALSGTELLVGGADGRIAILDADSLALKQEFRAHQGATRALTPLADGGFASGGEDDTVAIWTRDASHERARYQHADFVRALLQLPDGSLVSGSYDGTLRRTLLPAEPESIRDSRGPARD